MHSQLIVLVEDDADLQHLISTLLTINGMKAEILFDGKDLEETLLTQKPALILMDINLGDTDGRQLCRWVKDDPRYQHIPVILYSAGMIPAESITASGADAFIRKPFDIYSLLGLIRKCIAEAA